MLLLAGVTIGWALAGNVDRFLAPGEQQSNIQSDDDATEAPPDPRNLSIPSEDVSGSDIQGLNRYPGSVRIEYIREDQGDMTWTEVEYLTDADLSQVREFYRDSFRTEGWSVNDVGFAQSSWIFFVVKDEREVFVEIKPRGGIVEVDIEQTEPQPENPQEDTEQNDDQNESQDDGGDDQSNQQTADPASVSEPVPVESAPVESAPVESVPETPAPVQATPAPAPVYGDFDDYGEYDDDYEGYDD